MKALAILRGIPGCGKSTWIRENNLQDFTISSDTIRLMYQAPVVLTDGSCAISQANDADVWSTLLRILERRMERGSFTILDACHINASSFSRYYTLASNYGYDMYCVDFSDIDLDLALARNESRKTKPEDRFRYVPAHVVKSFHERIIAAKIPEYVRVIKPQNFWTTFKNLEKLLEN